MIILGDVAIPDQGSAKTVAEAIRSAGIRKNQSVVLNLEGLLSDDASLLTAKTPVLFNHPATLDVFGDFDVKVAALANNHTLDLPHLLEPTRKQLKQQGFLPVGAGNRRDADFSGVWFQEAGEQIYLINACWDFLLYHQNNSHSSTAVNAIREQSILEEVKAVRKSHPAARMVFFVHWSFDLEVLPFPSYRRFAKDLIDAGVSLVVGAHAHCVQGGEPWGNGYIVYGLGNFFLPNNVYASGKLAFPPMSRMGWALEWELAGNRLWCHVFDYERRGDTHHFAPIGKALLQDSAEVKKHTPFAGMSDREYEAFFRKHRRKRAGIPIFTHYNRSLENAFKMGLLKTRARMARTLARLGLIGWQN